MRNDIYILKATPIDINYYEGEDENLEIFSSEPSKSDLLNLISKWSDVPLKDIETMYDKDSDSYIVNNNNWFIRNYNFYGDIKNNKIYILKAVPGYDGYYEGDDEVIEIFTSRPSKESLIGVIATQSDEDYQTVKDSYNSEEDLYEVNDFEWYIKEYVIQDNKNSKKAMYKLHSLDEDGNQIDKFLFDRKPSFQEVKKILIEECNILYEDEDYNNLEEVDRDIQKLLQGEEIFFKGDLFLFEKGEN